MKYTKIAAGAAALAVITMSASACGSSGPDPAVCKAAMTRGLASALASPSGPSQSEPAACKGLPASQVSQIAGQVLGQALTASPSAPATTSQADALQAWKDAGGASALTPLGHDLEAVHADLDAISGDLSAGSDTGTDASTLSSDGQSLSADATAALADPPPGSLAAGWNTAMDALQAVGRDAVTVASDFTSGDLGSADADVQTMTTDLADANSAMTVATSEVGS